MVSAFWFGVMNVWLNLVKASIRTKMFSLPSFERSTFVKSIHSNPLGYGLSLLLALFLDLHNHPLQFDNVDNFSHSWLHLGTWYFNKISPSIRQEYVLPPDDLGYHVTDEASVLGTL